MNKTQDKFSLPAVTLSIFAAAAAERLRQTGIIALRN